ncbi:TIGR04282 family arsenosugar biosynthesis glycosyltransferase [Anabaena sp. UHCC 0451]|uniref:TIGR04282 family arsenosugar biosynthesis glycosyltransferase n=1 Tax=Anabaena sp. UHCC 0451 TaxID=2055235 RepID=UPI002B1EDA6F|nr:TIGR04282 family arsenosugar biosynthesis glycosyltransferase [Anabaena sp. UHCC 0451]MEA5575416.1 TIGR04282 family arsenosugar biosynthesis glycosyltransferase [Anabaena sp. UHCC 0451]
MAKQHLIIFTRYPEPGKTKTRLINALGDVGAALLQKQMTEHTILQVKELQQRFAITVEVRFAGGNWELMQNWLGLDFMYQTQSEGDLGQRMIKSLADAFNNYAEQVIIIGTDCPGLTSHILASAFEKLQVCDLVLGPALDGGYYLIGLRRVIPELFSQIPWGTSQVFPQTVEIARKLNLSSVYLPSLADVDLPEDLSVWEHIQMIAGK